ncbi:MAG: ribbon-helix-helix domain-containing protein [Patescibacteria group bacterium]
MSTISVPLSPELENELDRLVEEEVGSSRADVMRKGLKYLLREEGFRRIREAEEDIKAGRLYEGDIDEIVKHIR